MTLVKRIAEEEKGTDTGPDSKLSLLALHQKHKRDNFETEQSQIEKQLAEERAILDSMKAAKDLMSVEELAKGIRYTEPIKTCM